MCNGEIVERIVVRRVQFDRFSIGLQCLFIVLLLKVEVPEMEVGIGRFRGDCNGFFIALLGTGKIFDINQCLGPTYMPIYMLRVHGNQLAQHSHCIFITSLV